MKIRVKVDSSALDDDTQPVVFGSLHLKGFFDKNLRIVVGITNAGGRGSLTVSLRTYLLFHDEMIAAPCLYDGMKYASGIVRLRFPSAHFQLME